MSVHVSSLVWKADFPMTEKLILLKLADHASDDGSNVYPAQKSVARDCGCSTRTVQRVVKQSCDNGILTEIPGPGNRPKEYRFCLEAVRQRVTIDTNSIPTESRASTTESRASTTESRAINKNRYITVIEPLLEKTLFAGVVCPQNLYDAARKWESYRKQSKLKPWVSVTWKENFKKYKDNPDLFRDSVNFSISKGYQGIFEDKPRQKEQSAKQAPRAGKAC